ARLQRIDHARRTDELGGKAVVRAELDLVGEVIRPRCWQVLGVAHGKRHDLPADILEQTIMLEKQHLCAAARIIVVVDRQQAVRGCQHATRYSLPASGSAVPRWLTSSKTTARCRRRRTRTRNNRGRARTTKPAGTACRAL